MSLYGSQSMERTSEAQVQKASQACMSCRKQKRKCSKTLPACALCHRMGRHCDYSDLAPTPTSEDFHALRMKLIELESRLKYGQRNFMPPYPNSMTHTGLPGQDEQIEQLQQISGLTHPMESWLGAQNKFPSIAFLNGFAFSRGGYSAPRPALNLPSEILEILGGGFNVEASINTYFASVHQWIPFLSKKKLTKYMAKSLWEFGPDLALLYLCIKLVISRPKDGMDCAQSELYLATKRFITLMESTGLISILVLQANILISLYEYGQSIYPAAWITSGWSLRYGNLLGINGDKAAIDLLGTPIDEIDKEERRRAWWAVLLVDRIISIGNMAYIANPQEPKGEDLLPVDDNAWDKEELLNTPRYTVSTPISENFTPFSRLCQAYILMGKVMLHRRTKEDSERAQFAIASQLYAENLEFSHTITQESMASKDFFGLISPIALTFSSLFFLFNPYCCFGSGANEQQKQMQKKAAHDLETVALSIINFADQVNIATQTIQDLDRVSPFIMDGIYAGSLTLAWLNKKKGDESYQSGLESLRQCLRKLSTRWRNAAEYVRISEAHEVAFALSQS